MCRDLKSLEERTAKKALEVNALFSALTDLEQVQAEKLAFKRQIEDLKIMENEIKARTKALRAVSNGISVRGIAHPIQFKKRGRHGKHNAIETDYMSVINYSDNDMQSFANELQGPIVEDIDGQPYDEDRFKETYGDYLGIELNDGRQLPAIEYKKPSDGPSG